MALLCIPKQLASNLKQAAVEGKIDIGKMYDMTSAQRRELFTSLGVDRKLSKEINTAFEKAMISERQTALKDWAEEVFTGGEKKSVKYSDVLDKIKKLDKLGALTPKAETAYLEDLVATKLGATVTSEEATKIVQLSGKLESLANERSEFGTPSKAYFKAMREMEKYLDSITPSSRLRVLTETIGRGTMLASFKSPLLNIESNTINAGLQLAERRIANRSLGGLNGKYASRYAKFVREIYKESGYDISRMESLTLDRKQLGEDVANVEGPGVIRKVGRFYRDVVFERLMTAPDVAFSSFHSADSMNLLSTKMAKAKGLTGEALQQESLRYFKDATAIDPMTPEGKVIRSAAILDAQIATYTDNTTYSDVALGIRKIFNLASGDLRLGDQMMPFVKTPANVIGLGIDASGILLPVDTSVRMFKTINAIREGSSFKEAFGESFTGFGRKLTRAGLGMTFAYLLSATIEPEDFMGEWPTSQKEQELLRLKNAPTNSVRVKGKWYSLDYFGSLGAPLIGFLYAKKYGNNLKTAVLRYYQGVGKESLKIPGFTQMYDTYKSISDSKPDKEMSEGEITKYVTSLAVDYLRSRLIPALVGDIAKATDKVERQTDKNKPTDKIKSVIPGLRQTLPEKYNVFGETIQSEGWSTIFAGARIKTAPESKLIKELERLDQADNLPAIADVTKTSPRAKELKQQIGQEKFDEAMKYYGSTFKLYLEKVVNNPAYPKLDDEKKKKLIDSYKNKVFEMMLVKYKYKKVKK